MAKTSHPTNTVSRPRSIEGLSWAYLTLFLLALGSSLYVGFYRYSLGYLSLGVISFLFLSVFLWWWQSLRSGSKWAYVLALIVFFFSVFDFLCCTPYSEIGFNTVPLLSTISIAAFYAASGYLLICRPSYEYFQINQPR